MRGVVTGAGSPPRPRVEHILGFPIGLAARSVELNVGQVYELKDGRIIRTTNYLTHDDVREVAGLSE
jgi:hypothetical protein